MHEFLFWKFLKQAVFFVENNLPLQPKFLETNFFSSNKGEIHAHR